MATRTKREMLDQYFELIRRYQKEVDPLRKEVVSKGLVTIDEAYYTHDLFNWEGSQKILEILDKAIKGKEFERCLKRVSKDEWVNYITDMENRFDLAIDFFTQAKNQPPKVSESSQAEIETAATSETPTVEEEPVEPESENNDEIQQKEIELQVTNLPILYQPVEKKHSILDKLKNLLDMLFGTESLMKEVRQ